MGCIDILFSLWLLNHRTTVGKRSEEKSRCGLYPPGVLRQEKEKEKLSVRGRGLVPPRVGVPTPPLPRYRSKVSLPLTPSVIVSLNGHQYMPLIRRFTFESAGQVGVGWFRGGYRLGVSYHPWPPTAGRSIRVNVTMYKRVYLSMIFTTIRDQI